MKTEFKSLGYMENTYIKEHYAFIERNRDHAWLHHAWLYHCSWDVIAYPIGNFLEYDFRDYLTEEIKNACGD